MQACVCVCACMYISVYAGMFVCVTCVYVYSFTFRDVSVCKSMHVPLHRGCENIFYSVVTVEPIMGIKYL